MRAPLALVPALLLSGCGPVLFAEVESPEACVTVPDTAIPGAGALAGTATDLEYDLAAELPVLEEPDVEYELRLLELRIRLPEGSTTDLGGIDRVRILAMPPPEAGLPAFEVVRYDRDPGAPPPAELVAGGGKNVDLGAYLMAGRLALRAEYEGTGLPAEDWTADVRACFHARALVDYGSYAGL